ncbi:MAG: SurA N-terminal domain-containing protein [Gemmatimonadota bacterium]|nr:SurA N-terminal domain-containing protein [Gemmatimonadota bacterium]
MMQAFRSLATKVAAAVFAVLMLVFVITSVDWSQVTGGSQTTVGEINGVRIQLRQYQAMVQQETERRQRQSGHTLSAEEVEEARKTVWEELIRQQSLEKEYTDRGITVGPDEIAEAIQQSPPNELLQQAEFQTDGQFDITKYQRWLRSSAAIQVVPVLEAQYAEQIRQSKLLRVVTADVYISDAGLWQNWKDANEKVTLEVAALLPRSVVPDSAVPVTDADLRKYYEEHPDEFKRPATAYLSYVQLLRAADQSDSVAAHDRAVVLRKEILDGAPFDEVAQRESSDSASAAKGGDLGEFGKGSMDPAFERTAFSLPIGTVSAPVLSAFGYHLIKVESRSGAKVRARQILVPIEITGAHRDLLDARADSLEGLAADKLDPAAFDTAARILGLRIGQALPLQQGSRAQIGVQVIPDAGVWAFRAKPGESGEIIELSYADFLFRLDSLQPEGVPPFDKIRPAVGSAARNARKLEGTRRVGEDLLKRIREGSTLAQAATALGLPHQEFAAFSRVNPPFPSAKVVGTAFGLAPGKTSGLIETPEGLYVLRVIKHEPVDSAAFATGIDDYRVQQIRLARQDRARSYLEAITATAKIVDRRADIFRTEAQAEAIPTNGRRS